MSNDHGYGEKLLTKGEIAQLCRVEIRTVDRWLAAGKIRFFRTPSGRMLFRKNDVLIVIDRDGGGSVLRDRISEAMGRSRGRRSPRP